MKEKRLGIKVSVIVVTLMLLYGLTLLTQYVEEGYSQVVLSEVCSYNDSAIHDTLGRYHDYIEIFNPTEVTQDISGYYLSDDKNNLTKYMFPSDTYLPAKGYILLWAGEWEEGNLLDDASFYTGFSVKAGETLYLSNAQGNVLDTVKIPAESMSGMAYSRVSISNEVWKQTPASPGELNILDVPVANKKLDTKVEFNKISGFYDEAFYLEMFTEDKYDIYYTLDGTIPTTESTKYVEKIWIDDVSANENKYASIENISLLEEVYIPTYNVEKATVVRAIAVNEQGEVSEESYASYFVNYNEKKGFDGVPTVSIITDPDNLFGEEKGLYVTGILWETNKEVAVGASEYWRSKSPVNYRAKGRGWKRDALIQYFDESDEMIYEQKVLLGNHGKSSSANNQKSFNLYGVSESGSKEYIFDGIFGTSSTTMMLRSGGGDCYATKLRDAFTQELVRDRALPTINYQPCQVFIDGEYWGLYMLQERVCEDTLVNQYEVEADNIVLLKCEEVVAGEENDLQLWNEMVAFAIENDLSEQSNYEQIEQMIDVQNCIDYYGFEIYVAHSDWLKNNYARWRVKETGEGQYEDGKWRWMSYDLDSSTGRKEGMSSADVDTFLEGNYWYSALEEEFFASLMENEEFKQRFVVSFMDMANRNFKYETVAAKLDVLAEKLCDATVVSQKRFYTIDYDASDYMQEVQILKDFYANRYGYITSYLKTDLNLAGVLVDVHVENKTGGQVVLNTLCLEENEKFSGAYYSDYPVELAVIPNEGYHINGWLVNGEVYENEEIVVTLAEATTIIPLWEADN